MPGPTTEILNEDIKELKAEIRDIRDDLATLKADVHYMAIATAQDRATLSFFKWAGSMMVATLFSTGLAGVIWGASLTTKVNLMESRISEKFQEAGVRIDKLESRIDRLESRIDARFDKLEASIAKLLNQPKPTGPAGAPAGN